MARAHAYTIRSVAPSPPTIHPTTQFHSPHQIIVRSVAPSPPTIHPARQTHPPHQFHAMPGRCAAPGSSRRGGTFLQAGPPHPTQPVLAKHPGLPRDPPILFETCFSISDKSIGMKKWVWVAMLETFIVRSVAPSPRTIHSATQVHPPHQSPAMPGRCAAPGSSKNVVCSLFLFIIWVFFG
jgi:hypothetical protein